MHERRNNKQHHLEQQPSVQVRYMQQDTSLVKVFEEMGNLFMDKSGDLIYLPY
jgi:hypothetical protein